MAVLQQNGLRAAVKTEEEMMNELKRRLEKAGNISLSTIYLFHTQCVCVL